MSGQASPKLAGERALHVEALRAERGQRAGGTAELEPLDARPQLVEPLHHGQQRRQPDGDLVAEGDGQGVLQVGAPGHRDTEVARGLCDEGVDDIEDETRDDPGVLSQVHPEQRGHLVVA